MYLIKGNSYNQNNTKSTTSYTKVRWKDRDEMSSHHLQTLSSSSLLSHCFGTLASSSSESRNCLQANGQTLVSTALTQATSTQHVKSIKQEKVSQHS
jgi:hypothetical protein